MGDEKEKGTETRGREKETKNKRNGPSPVTRSSKRRMDRYQNTPCKNVRT